MAVLVQYSASCAVSSALRNVVRATTPKSAVVRHRTKSTHSGAPQPRRIESSDASPSTSSLSTPPNSVDTGRHRRPNRTPISGPPKISTLDHTRLIPRNFLVLSNIKKPEAQVYRPSVSETQAGDNRWRFRTKLHAAGMDDLVFPPHARGFLYYHLAPNAPALSGQVRFRVTETDDPALFSSGEDLLRDDYLPWRIPVVALASRKNYTVLSRRLLDDGLVSEHVLRAAASLPPDVTRVRAGRMVHALGQPFRLAFGQPTQPFYFIGPNTIMRGNFVPVAVWRGRTGTRAPRPTIRGAALCRFEKSARPEHAGRRVVVCRVVRILGQLERTEFCRIPDRLMPREGELLTRAIVGVGSDWSVEEWTFDVDRRLPPGPDVLRRQLAAGLDLLYDNEARAGGPVGW